MDSVVMVEIEVDVLERLEAACRAAITALPRGDRGVEAAILWLRALPAACRLGLGDVTESAPGLFRLFVAAGLIPSCPSDSAMTAAIRLIASVSPLVTKRSARTWTAWLGSAGDPESAITATLRASVTPAMLASPRPVPLDAPRRAGSIRSERDRLAADLQAARQELERERGSVTTRIDELTADRDRLAADLARVREEQDRQRRADVDRIDQVTAERDRLAGDLSATREEAERQRRESSARVYDLEAKCDRLSIDLNAAMERHHEDLAGRDRVQQSTAAALGEARAELARCHHDLQDAERRCSEAVQGARSRNERIRTLTEARDHLNSELERQVGRAHDLRDKLTAAETAVTEQTSRADELRTKAASLTSKCRAIEAELEAASAERDRHAASLAGMNKSIARVRADLAASQTALADEKTAHTGTRQTLKIVEERSRQRAQECQQLKDTAAKAEGAKQALAQICEWLTINAEEHEVDAQLEAILTAIDHQQRSRQELLNRAEGRLLRHVRHACELLYTLQCFQHAHPGSNFDAQVERNLAGIHETADEIVRKDMKRLAAIETAGA